MPGGFVAMSREHAQLLLLGIAFVAGAMASYTAESAAHIVKALTDARQEHLLNAACTVASVATAPAGIRVVAAVLPACFGGFVMWRKASGKGLVALLVFFCAPFILVAFYLVKTSCR
jgi:hypothetical protein